MPVIGVRFLFIYHHKFVVWSKQMLVVRRAHARRCVGELVGRFMVVLRSRKQGLQYRFLSAIVAFWRNPRFCLGQISDLV